MLTKEQAISRLYSDYPNTRPETKTEQLDVEEYVRQYEKQTQYPIYGAAIGVLVKGDRLLLSHRKGVHSGWSLLGGRVEEQEEFQAAFQREVMEEAGVKVNVTDLITLEKKVYYSPEGNSLELWLATFVATYEGDLQKTDQAEQEGLEIAEFSISTLPEMHPDDFGKINIYFAKQSLEY